MVGPLRHRQTKGAETDMSDLQKPRHISTPPFATDRRAPKIAPCPQCPEATACRQNVVRRDGPITGHQRKLLKERQNITPLELAANSHVAIPIDAVNLKN